MKLIENGSLDSKESWAAGPEDIAVDLSDQRWLTVETASNGDRVVALFTLCPWTLLDAAERALRAASLRERNGRTLAVGIYHDALVVSTRLAAQPLQPEVEAAVSDLARFSDMCMQ